MAYALLVPIRVLLLHAKYSHSVLITNWSLMISDDHIKPLIGPHNILDTCKGLKTFYVNLEALKGTQFIISTLLALVMPSNVL